MNFVAESLKQKNACNSHRGKCKKNLNSKGVSEKWLYGFLDNRNIVYEKEKPYKDFFLDIVVGNKVIEIDGEQHYNAEKFPEQIERDKRKDSLLKEDGFEELRIRWSWVQSNKDEAITLLEEFLK